MPIIKLIFIKIFDKSKSVSSKWCFISNPNEKGSPPRFTRPTKVIAVSNGRYREKPPMYLKS